MAESSQEFGTVIGADASFKGDLKFESAAKVLGRFEGSINSKGKVHIADGSSCKATVAAKEIEVAGRIDGNVEAGDRIELKPTGVVTGDIVATRMTMSEGASINGHCRIGPNNGQSGSKAASTTEPKVQAKAVEAEVARK
ncbi:MAG: polymer-forming cytoskeletal protein [Planctomycetes bacterium]|nr:polymer-forming cytoskeletal protein [Planctomycetota bacterium]